jgi:hypothetical protein
MPGGKKTTPTPTHNQKAHAFFGSSKITHSRRFLVFGSASVKPTNPHLCKSNEETQLH